MVFNFLLYEIFDTQKAYSYSFTDVSAEADSDRSIEYVVGSVAL